MSKIAPFGSWKSPFTANSVASARRGLSEPQIGEDGIYWLERRPIENGRVALMCRQANTGITELTTEQINVGTSVHEYGGGSYVVQGRKLYFSCTTDNQIYRINEGHISQITDLADHRFADLMIDPNTDWLYAVLENHQAEGEPTNTLVRIEPGTTPKSTRLSIIASGHDFYASPRLHQRKLVWLCWNHPHMPWDNTELWGGGLNAKGELSEPPVRLDLGKKPLNSKPQDKPISLFQPEYSKAGELFVVSDESGWWNLCRCTNQGLSPLFEYAADFGLPQWQFGMRTYATVGHDDLIATCRSDNATLLWRIQAGKAKRIAHDFIGINQIQADDRQAVCIATFHDKPPALMRLDLANYSWQQIATSADEDPKLKPYISPAKPFSFEVASQHGARQAHAFFYPPTNPDFGAPKAAKPPLLVMSHGGPTAATAADYSPKIQFWTSRGFAVADVDYTGSTGYGRAYRDLLKGNWGVFDLEDCAAAAGFLVAKGEVDPNQLCIRGSSAGGFTTLGALTFTDTFKVGASYYGIGDLEALAKHTHKFESRYLDSLIGPYPAAKATYLERSPIQHIDKLSCPAIFFQGLKDKIVPPEQAEAMVSALEAKGVLTKILRFEEESHGFVQSDNIILSLLSELAFYGRVLGFTPASDES